MDRAVFENVYLHANCIAELGLCRAMVAAAGAPPAVVAVPQEGRDAPAAWQEDESAVAGVLGFGELTPEQHARLVTMTEAALRGDPGDVDGTSGDESFGMAIGVGPLDPEWGPPDVGLYLAQAYDARDALRSRIDECYARADLAGLAAALAALPSDLSPLAAAMDADALEAYLVRYEAGDAALADLVVQVRRLEPQL
jgi:hypothetical protein